MGKRIWALALVLWVAACSFGQQTSTITEIVITGSKNVTQDAIIARMKTKVGQPYVQAQLDQDRAAIEQMGFFKKVDIRAIPLEGDNWRIAVDVAEFEIVKEVRIVGNTVFTTEQIMEKLEVQIGQPFNLFWQKPSADAVAKLYSDKGYFALVEQLEPLEESPGTVSVVVREMKITSVTVQGNVRTRDWIMQRLIKSRPGDIYNARKWEDDLRRIINTRWFDKVTPLDKQSEEGFGVDLIVDVQEARTGQVVFGVTMDPRSSFAGQIRVSDSNFRGTGQTIGLNLSQGVTGATGTSVDLDYVNPFIDNRDTSMSVSLYSRLLYRFQGNFFGGNTTPTDERFTERRTGGAIAFTRPIGRDLTASIGLRAEAINTSDVNTNTTTAFIQQDGTVAIGTFGLAMNRRDVDLDPSRGDWMNFTFEPGFSNITEIGGAVNDPAILGNNSFYRTTLEYRTYWSDQPPRGRQLDASRRVLALRARYGFISGKVPFFEQYFAGGSDTLRGYDDDRFWGKQILLTSLEYRLPIQKSFSIIAFVDYGGAWGGYGSVNQFTQSDKFKLNIGYGLGASFKTPFGPLRLDFGFNDRGKSRTHFMIGTSF